MQKRISVKRGMKKAMVVGDKDGGDRLCGCKTEGVCTHTARWGGGMMLRSASEQMDIRE